MPASAAGPVTVTITATRHAALTLRFTRPVTVYNGDVDDGERGPTISGGGDLAGFLLVPRQAGAEATGTVAMTLAGIRLAVTAGQTKATLPAGSYTLRVLATSPVTIRLPVGGLTRPVTWRATSALAVVRRAATFAPDTGPFVTGAAQLRLGPSSVALLTATYHVTAAALVTETCITRAASCRDEAAWVEHEDHRWIPPATHEQGIDVALLNRGELPAGSYTGSWTFDTTGITTVDEAAVTVIG